MTSKTAKTVLVTAIFAVVATAGMAWLANGAMAAGDRPAAPSGIAVQAAGEHTVNVIWTAHPDGARDYRVAWRPDGEPYRSWRDRAWNAFPSGAGYTITGLDAGATYQVRVRARFENGPGSEWSSEASVTTEESGNAGRSNHVERPRNLRITARSWSGISLAWDTPTGADITHTEVTRRGGGLDDDTIVRPAANNAINYRVLVPASAYTFSVRFGTSSTDFGPTREIQATTLAVPAPTGLRVLQLQHDRVEIGWDNPVDTTALGINIRIYRLPDLQLRSMQDLSSTPDSYEDTSVVPGEQYRYVVRYRAVSLQGFHYGDSVDTSLIVPQALLPFDLEATPGQGSVSLNWRNPLGHTITRHRVERSEGTAGIFETVGEKDGDGTHYADINLDAATTYRYRVYLGDSNRYGDYVETRATTPDLPPLTAPTNFRVLNGTEDVNAGLWETESTDPQLEWDVDDASTGAYLTRRLIDPPPDVACAVPNNCPVLIIHDAYGTRNTGYTDISNGGGQYRYGIQSRGRDGALGPQATILVLVPSLPAPTRQAPTNLRVSASSGGGRAAVTANWNGHSQYPGYLVQWRIGDRMFDQDEDGARSDRIVASNRINMYFADGKSYRPAATTKQRIYARDSTPSPWEVNHYVRVGTCADAACAIADVLFAPEESVRLGANPYR